MKYIKLNEVCEINIGKTPSRNNQEFWGQGIKWLSIADLKNKYITESKEEITQSALQKCNMRIIPQNTVVMSFKLSIGKVSILKEAMCTNEAIANFPIKNNKKILSEYLYYALKTLNFDSSTDRAVMGATLNKTKLNEINIPFVDISIQQKIAEALDKAQSLIDKRKVQIEALDELIKSVFYEMFGDIIINSKGWEVKLLGEVCEMKAGKNIKASDIHNEKLDNFYPCYGGNGLRGYVEQYSHEGNIPLIGRQGALCGNVKYAQGKFYATEHAVVTQSKVEMNSYWLYFLLSQLNLNKLSTGAAQPGLTIGNLNLVEIPIAPTFMQNEFEKLAKQVDKLKFEMQKSLTQFETNFDALMQKAFKGELFN